MNCNFEKKRKKRKEKARYRVPVRFGLVKKEFKKVIFLVGSVCYGVKILIFVA